MIALIVEGEREVRNVLTEEGELSEK